jgi:transglutaminase-like putative cysteine protease
VPVSGADQEVTIVSLDKTNPLQFTRETKYGNRLAYIEGKANAEGKVPVQILYRIARREVGESTAVASVDAKYLQPDALVPIGGKPLLLLADQSLPNDQLAEARVLYNVVDDHLQYRKDRPGWGRGDAVWACESGFGNCTDFHSLFISLCRSEGIPSTFEIGFSIPEKHGSGQVTGYHCWAKFKPAGHGWVPVDISEANQNPDKREYFFGHLCENRVAFSTGRDLTLEPHQAGPPVNFLVYPYVEVDGHPYPAAKIEHHFSYEDVP